jgi:hypothetical protein
MSWQLTTLTKKPASFVPESVIPTGSSQQSAAVLHSPEHVLPLAATPYELTSHTPAPPADGTQASPKAQSRAV